MLYNIHKDFKGSQDGRITEDFKAGTQADLSDYLAGCIEKEWASPVVAETAPPAAPSIENKAVTTDGKGGRKPKSGDKA